MSSNIINRKEALSLLENESLLTLGEMANDIKKKIHNNSKLITFVIDRNINYTNICKCKCKFCAFYREEDSKDAYLLDKEQIFQKIEETIDLQGTQILIQGGLHPLLKINYFTDLFSSIKNRYNINIHGLSAPEIWHIAQNSGISVEDTLKRLKDSGLGSIPGGGAEILVDKVRSQISPNKISWDKWAYVIKTAHKLGIRTSATMMFGTVENSEDIVEHLFRVREIQEESGGFTAFICWSFQPLNTELHKSVNYSSTGVDFLKILALSRIVLNNIKNIQTSWVTQGSKIAQTSLFFGANDFGSTMIEENVVAAAGVNFRMSIDDIVYLIKDAGFEPAQRDTFYNIVRKL